MILQYQLALQWFPVQQLSLFDFYEIRVLRLRRLIFLISWMTTGKQMVLYHSELTVLRCLVVRLRHVQFFQKNRRSFAWKCFVRKQHLLDLAHLETSIQPTAVYIRVNSRLTTCHDVEAPRSYFWSISFDQSTRALF